MTHRAGSMPGPAPVARAIRGRGPAARVTEARVVDDLPRPVPIERAELDVLEMYLGPALDGLLRAMMP